MPLARPPRCAAGAAGPAGARLMRGRITQVRRQAAPHPSFAPQMPPSPHGGRLWGAAVPGGPVQRADLSSAPTARRESLRQPPGQRVTRGDRSTGKPDDHLVYPPGVVMRGRSSSRERSGAGTTGSSMSAGPIRTPPVPRAGRTPVRPSGFLLTGRGRFLLPQAKENGGGSPSGSPPRRGK